MQQLLARAIATVFVILNSGALDKVCLDVESEVEAKHLEGQDAVDFVMKQLSKGMRTRSHLKRSLEAVIRGEDCSRSSLDYVATIGVCHWGRSLKQISDAATKYATECLTPEHLKEIFLTETEISFNLGRALGGKKLWEVIDNQFLEDYQDANPGSKGKRLSEIELYSDDLVKPFANLINRYADKREKDMKSEGAVRSYIQNYVVTPCKDYAAAAERVMNKIDEAGRLIPNGGKRALYELLDSEAQMVIFRRNLCKQISFALDDKNLAASVLKQQNSDI